MKDHRIEVFIEKNCRSCEEVLRSIDSLLNRFRFSLKVYERHVDQHVFRARSVIVCPATFVDERLAFYGPFSGEELARYITTQSLNHNKEYCNE